MKQRMTLFMAILLIGIGLSNAQVSQVTGCRKKTDCR